jgi:hypothetical protein
MADPRDDRIELTDLDVITRYSLAVRAATAEREELIAALQSDLAWLEQGRRPRPAAATPRRTATKTSAAKKTPAAKKTTGRRSR